MRRSCPILASPPQRFRPLPERVFSPSVPCFYPHDFTKTPVELPLLPQELWTCRMDSRSVAIPLFGRDSAWAVARLHHALIILPIADGPPAGQSWPMGMTSGSRPGGHEPISVTTINPTRVITMFRSQSEDRDGEAAA